MFDECLNHVQHIYIYNMVHKGSFYGGTGEHDT